VLVRAPRVEFRFWISIRIDEYGVLFQSFKRGGGYWVHRIFLRFVPEDHELVWGGPMVDIWAFKGDWLIVFERIWNYLREELSYVV